MNLNPVSAARELAALNLKVAKGARRLATIKDDDVQIATTPKELVFKQDNTSLYHYLPRTETQISTPVVLVYGLIGRYTMADLQEDRSLIRNMLDMGVDMYAVDWGNPSRADRWLTLEDYIDGYMVDCIDTIKARHGVDQVTILGVCEGGVFSLCYAARYPESVKNLITTITPVDFHGDLRDDQHGFINLWSRSLEPEDIDKVVEACGNLPGEVMGWVFSMMTPVKTMTKYNLDLIDIASDDDKLMNFLRMEKWLADRPHHPGEAAKQWIKELYQDNKLMSNELELGGEKVDLRKITMPVLNVFALRDHIVPPECSKALRYCVGSKDYTDLPLPGGHVGVFVSGRSQGILGKGIVDWLKDHD